MNALKECLISYYHMVVCPKCGTEMTKGSTNVWVQTGPKQAIRIPNNPRAMICDNCGYVEFWLKK